MQTTIKRTLRLSSRVYTFRVMPQHVRHNPAVLSVTVLKRISPLESMYVKAYLKIAKQDWLGIVIPSLPLKAF